MEPVVQLKGGSRELVIAEAERRGISVTRFTDSDQPIVALEYRGRRDFWHGGNTNRLGHAAFQIFRNKALANTMLREAGFPVPAEIFTSSLKEMTGFLERYKKVVIKPQDKVWGLGVTTGIVSSAELEAAFQRAVEHTDTPGEGRVICQQHIDGKEYRLLVINGRQVWAVRRVPAAVTGDGKKSVAELVQEYNAGAAEGRKITVTEETQRALNRQGITLESRPESGQTVHLAGVANAHMGGTVHDVTDEIGEGVRTMALAAAAYFQAPLVGIDCISEDIRQTTGMIIELNSAPDLTLHVYPTYGQPQPVAAAIVDMLFPETAAKSL